MAARTADMAPRQGGVTCDMGRLEDERRGQEERQR